MLFNQKIVYMVNKYYYEAKHTFFITALSHYHTLNNGRFYQYPKKSKQNHWRPQQATYQKSQRAHWKAIIKPERAVYRL